jgi:hypothetical protein
MILFYLQWELGNSSTNEKKSSPKAALLKLSIYLEALETYVSSV